jgi:hypothetical protein
MEWRPAVDREVARERMPAARHSAGSGWGERAEEELVVRGIIGGKFERLLGMLMARLYLAWVDADGVQYRRHPRQREREGGGVRGGAVGERSQGKQGSDAPDGVHVCAQGHAHAAFRDGVVAAEEGDDLGRTTEGEARGRGQKGGYIITPGRGGGRRCDGRTAGSGFEGRERGGGAAPAPGRPKD